MNADSQSEFRVRFIVLQAQAGDREAFHELVEMFQSRVLYYLLRLVPNRDRALDILQDVWVDVFCSIGRLRSPDAFRVWLYRLAHNRAVSNIRRAALEQRTEEQLSTQIDDIDSWNEIEALEQSELVHFALDQLSVLHREVLTLRFLEEMDLNQIAEATGCTLGTAKSRLHYAKLALRHFLTEQDNG